MPGPGSYLIGEEERKEINEVLDTGYLFRYGSIDNPKFLHKAYTFEQEFGRYCGVKNALLTSSGTSSLLIALLGAGIRPGDEVIVPAYTFIATYSAIIFAGGVPVLAEIDESLTLDPDDIESRITPRTRAILPVHMLGNPCRMDEIMAIAKKHGLLVIEDACQALGGSYRNRKLGSIGNAGAFSLNVFKTITAGDGGIFITNDDEIYERAFGAHDQGHKPMRAGVEVGNRSILGLNFRANELLAAVAIAQFRKLGALLATLKTKKNRFKDAIGKAPGFKFRDLGDPEGECATLCTVIFDTAERATRIAKTLCTNTLDHSGWHVYANMEHINRHLKQVGQPYGKGAYSRTDDILSRSLNLSVGVVDGGLGAAFGINIQSTDDEIDETAERFCEACRKVNG